MSRVSLKFSHLNQFLISLCIEKDKIKIKFHVSCGNLRVMCIVLTKMYDDMKAQGIPADIQENDIIQISQFKSQLSSGKHFVVIKGQYKIVQSGVKVVIGDPLFYDDCLANNNFMSPKVEKTRMPGATYHHEEEKVDPRTSKSRYSGDIERTLGVGGDDEEDEEDYYPVKLISATSGEWIILVKVTKQHPLRTYKNSKTGEPGKIQTWDLADSSGTQIQLTGFNEQVDTFSAILKEGKIYKIGGCSVKPANKRYTSIPHDYALTLNRSSKVEIAKDQSKKISSINFNFQKIVDFKDAAGQVTVDFCGIVSADNGHREFEAKNGGGMRKIRKLIIIDDSKDENLEDGKCLGIEACFWGEDVDQIQFTEGEPLILQGARTNNYNGSVSINIYETSQIFRENFVRKNKKSIAVLKWYKESKPVSKSNIFIL